MHILRPGVRIVVNSNEIVFGEIAVQSCFGVMQGRISAGVLARTNKHAFNFVRGVTSQTDKPIHR